jgi:hypothetical protein
VAVPFVAPVPVDPSVAVPFVVLVPVGVEELIVLEPMP